ncbi:hypothetical protein EDI_309650 [Entamoeba dispar SAW760]|uniref:Leucine-rich repeat containing protein n=1 Tax=Entamoeba dispar (strain ATCC PRA-260 / SAW760) TaxID=370354 RepID=B0EJU3_ENTDS|nr:uncharacterized protein EDI_309650 [Entamoeba dispar SAW760]EDR25195.1 hypothetical protein EDI_309650 [Entamoeba dispar SAW760]|eukprot:EDR25195.1 hypothetical protein EDI_309650 [Entamoeba dispar SAW760]
MDVLSIQIVGSYFKELRDIERYVMVSRKYGRSVRTSKYPSLIPYSKEFKEVFPMVTSVIINNRSIERMGELIWQEGLEGIRGIEIEIDEETPEEAICIGPEIFGKIQGISIKKGRRTRNVYLIMNEIGMFSNLRRLEIGSELVMWKNDGERRTEEEIGEMIGRSYLKMIIIHHFDIVEHEIIKEVIGRWRGQGICYLKKGIESGIVQKNIANTPRNMLYFLTNKKITDEDVKLLSTQIVLYKKVIKGITMTKPTKEIAQWRSIFVLYGITCFGIGNCTADKGHKIFFKLPLIKKVELKGELIQRPWFFQSLESLRFKEEIEGGREKRSKMIWTYDIFQTLRRMKLYCSIETMISIKLPSGLESLKVVFQGEGRLEDEWRLEQIQLKELKMSNLDKEAPIYLPSTLERIGIKNIKDKYYDLYRLYEYKELKRIKVKECNDMQRLLIPDKVEEIIVKGCNKLEEIYKIEEKKEIRKMKIVDCRKLKIKGIPDKVEELTIRYCDSIRKVEVKGRKEMSHVEISSRLEELTIMAKVKGLILRMPKEGIDEDKSYINVEGEMRSMEIEWDKKNIKYPQRIKELRIKGIEGMENFEGLPDKNLRTLVINNVSARQGISIPTSLVELQIENSKIGNLYSLKNCHYLTSIEMQNCEDISTISIPYNVLMIKLKTLPSLTGLIHIPNSQLKSMEIENCTSIEVLQTPFSLKTLICKSCYNLGTFLNLNITKIVYFELSNNSKIKVINLPLTVCYLSINACYCLSSIAGLDSLYTCYYLRITHCPTLTTCTIPQTVRLFEISQNAFEIAY